MERESLLQEINRLDVLYLRFPLWIYKAKESGNQERMEKALEFMKKAHENYGKRFSFNVPNPRDYDTTGKGDYLKLTQILEENY